MYLNINERGTIISKPRNPLRSLDLVYFDVDPFITLSLQCV